MIGTFKYAWFLNKLASSNTSNIYSLYSSVSGYVGNDAFGESVSINSYGNVIAVGIPGKNSNGDDSGSVIVYIWNGTVWDQLGSEIIGEAGNDQFGSSVALNAAGDILAVGALYNDGGGTDSGNVRVFNFNGTGWTQMGADINGAAATNYFGIRISLNAPGDILAVGASSNDSNGTDSGQVKIFRWSGTAWTQLGASINGEAAGDRLYQNCLNAAGDRIIVGARMNDGGGTDSGHVRVFSWNGTAWVKLGLDINGGAAGDNFGFAVSMNGNGNIIAVGSDLSNANGTDSGSVKVYIWDGSAWLQRGSTLVGEAAGDGFGYSLSLNYEGDYLAVGAPNNDALASNSGSVRIYKWNTSDWLQMGDDLDGIYANTAGDEFGHCVVLNRSGTKLAVGIPLKESNFTTNSGLIQTYRSDTELPNGLIGSPMTSLDLNSKSGYSLSINKPGDIVAFGEPYSPGGGTNRGTARIFQLSGSTWNQLGQSLSGLTDNDNFGWSLSLNSGGNRIAIGAPFNDAGGANRGVTHILQLSANNAWTVLGAPISGVADNDYSGYSVALNSLGNRVIMGSPNSPGGGTLRGSARVFQYNGTAWAIMGAVLNGEANNDAYGTTVAMNASGDVIAIGAPLNDGGGVDAGHVRIFAWSGTAWVQRGADINGLSAGVNLGQYISLNDYGDVIAIGAPKGMDGAGYTIVYRWSGTAWVQLGSYIIGESANDNSGSVFLNSKGNRLIIGAPLNDANMVGSNQGHAKVYDFRVDNWILNTEINGSEISPGHGFGYSVGINFLGDIITASSISGNGGYTNVYKISRPNDLLSVISKATLLTKLNGESSNDRSGYSVSLNDGGDIIAIGAPFNNNDGTDDGHVRLYKGSGSNWQQLGLDIDGKTNQGGCGWSVSLNASGNRVAMGAPEGSPTYAAIFRWDNTQWVQMGADIQKGAGDNFGYSISLNNAGDIVAIGGIQRDSIPTGKGVTRIYRWDGIAWVQMGSDILGDIAGDQFGSAVSLNDAGTRVAIGANLHGEFIQGHVKVYDWNGSNWVQLGSDINGVIDGEQSGTSVALNSAGDILAIGSPLASIFPDSNSGLVRVYIWNGVAWVQRGTNIEGIDPGSGLLEDTGYSVSLNAAGDILAIGERSNNSVATRGGRVRIFYWNGLNWLQIDVPIYNNTSNIYSGSSVSLNATGAIIAIGAPGLTPYTGTGETRIYKLS